MNMGFFATACMCLLLGQAPNDIYYLKDRNARIPVNLDDAQRREFTQLILYVSTDQGRSWEQATAITPDKNFFAFYAKSDGLHWFRVATVDKAGKQDPDDRTLKFGPPSLKMVIDTVQPIVRVINVERRGEEVFINWEIQEDNPDRDGLHLEYQLKDAPTAAWTSIPVQYALKGQTSFRPGNNLPLLVRLTVRDLAKNQSFVLKETASAVTTAGLVTQGPANPPGSNAGSATLTDPPTLPRTLELPPMLPANPPAKVENLPGPPPVLPAEALSPTKFPLPPDSFQQGVIMPKPRVAEPPPSEKVIADSRIALNPLAGKQPLPSDPGNNPPNPAKTVANSQPARKPLPELIYVNDHQVTLEYTVKRVGPSGISGVELWLTRNDGETWERYAIAKDVQGEESIGRQKRTFVFRDREDRPFADGVYGLNLVFKSGAGRGREPRPGDVPEIRLEIDKEAPIAVLYQPTPDPQNPEQVLLKWFAKDKNLTATPIHLEYAAKREGPWLPIKLDLENKGRYPADEVSGDYSWKVPSDIPVQVYLRLRVRDMAGNESIAVSPEPQFVDLTVPEGTLITAHPTKQN